jgi:(E)-4-hydroxy-3-methyl-but-2-enyl pyrophosphate reductase
MARVKLAKSAGFCMGVRRAVNMALEAAMKRNGPIYTYGPLIHNPQVLEILGGKGIRAIGEGSPGGLPAQGAENSAGIIIRAHGVSPDEREKIKSLGAHLINATCPHVGKVQGIIQRHAKEGFTILIAGDRDHAEVMGLLGYAQKRGIVIGTLEELDALPPLEKVCLVTQTTQDHTQFAKLAEAAKKKFPEVEIFNTICISTHRRQEEVSALAARVDAMVVVGGKGSGNTRRLAKISEGAGVPTFHVETEKELNMAELARYPVIGVTAGASTPNWLILRVVERLQRLESPWAFIPFLRNLGRIAAISYLLLALGAACLAFAGALIQGLPPKISWILIAGFYVFSMHILNRLTDKASENFNQPARTDFYERHGKWMIPAGILSAAVALTLAWFEGTLPFLLLLAISALGMIYNLRVFPVNPGSRFHYQRLKDIPGSKTLFVALAWGVVTSLLSPLAHDGRLRPGTAVAFLFASILVFARTTLYDFKDIQGDLMVGKETIPIVLGRRKAEWLVVILLCILGAVLAAAGPLEWATPVTSVLLVSLAYVVFYYWLYRLRILGWAFLFEGVVDGSFIFVGFLAFLWYFFR